MRTVPRRSVTDYQKSAFVRHAEGQGAVLTDRVIWIRKGNGEWITKHRRSFFKRYPMLPQIFSGFLGIPLKAHRAILRGRLRKRPTLRFSGGPRSGLSLQPVVRRCFML